MMAASIRSKKWASHLTSRASVYVKSKPRPCGNCVILRVRANCGYFCKGLRKRLFRNELVRDLLAFCSQQIVAFFGCFLYQYTHFGVTGLKVGLQTTPPQFFRS